MRVEMVQSNGPEGKGWKIVLTLIARRRQFGERAAGIVLALLARELLIHRRAIHSAGPSLWFVRH